MAELDPRAAGAKRLQDKVCVVTGAGQGIGRTKVLSMEYGRYGIRINTVAPGGTEVPYGVITG